MSSGRKTFIPGKDRILYAKPVYGQREIDAVVRSLKSNWLGPGDFTKRFERKVAKVFGKKKGLFVNSGSSANLVAVEMVGLPRGSEVITQACTFPTTLSPIILKNLTPVFVDSEIGTYNINVQQIEEAVSPRTKAIFISHLLGNINEMKKLTEICRKRKLLFLEDSCDTIGGKFLGKPTGAWSDITTASFYAPHHMTAAGGGGMVMTDEKDWIEKGKSLRDWGSAMPGSRDGNYKERFGIKVSGVEYDAKFTYFKIGYNLKPIDLQAAFGLVQLERLAVFNARRALNFQRLYDFFLQHKEHFILPKSHPNAEVYWMAFPLTIREESPINRRELLTYFESRKIQTRLVFSGNILRHKPYKKIKHRISGHLRNADIIMRRSFLIGCHHGMSRRMIDYICMVFREYLKRL